MPVRKTKKKRVARRGRKFIVIRAGRNVYVAPLSALGRPVRNAELNKMIAALEKKKCCHHLHFAGVYTPRMYEMAFGNGHMPD